MNKNSLDYEKFVQENIHLEVSIDDDLMSTWENNLNDRMLSPRDLKKYQSFLSLLNTCLFSIFLFLIVVATSMIIWFFSFHPQEKIIFNDGTDITCLYDPKTEEMKQNDN